MVIVSTRLETLAETLRYLFFVKQNRNFCGGEGTASVQRENFMVCAKIPKSFDDFLATCRWCFCELQMVTRLSIASGGTSCHPFH